MSWEEAFPNAPLYSAIVQLWCELEIPAVGSSRVFILSPLSYRVQGEGTAIGLR